MKHCTVSEYASLRKVSYQAVKNAIEDQRLKNSVRKNEKGKWEILPDIADIEWNANTDVSKQNNLKNKIPRPTAHIKPGFKVNSDSGNSAMDFNSAKAQREYYLAELARLEFEEKSEKLIDADEAKSTWFKIITETKTKLLSLPTKARANLPHLTLADVSVLERLVRESLEELANGEH